MSTRRACGKSRTTSDGASTCPCPTASTSRFSVRAMRRLPKSSTCEPLAPTRSACPPSPRRSSAGIWRWRCSAFPASATWRRECCRSRSIIPKCWKRRIVCAVNSSRSWRGSLAGSDPAVAGRRSALVSAARRAREHAHAAFSHFKVGAALETADGTIVTGCNVENATYGLTICAERVAMFKAISEGYRTFTRIAVVADTEQPTPPCGACRQILWEFGGDLEVLLANLTAHTGTHHLQDLLPLPFDARLL